MNAENGIVLYHKPKVHPTKEEFRKAIIERLLDIDHYPDSLLYKTSPEKWRKEREMKLLRSGWNFMVIEDLLNLLI